MGELSLFRIELLHVAIVHFPIAFLSIATITTVLALLIRSGRPKLLSLTIFLLFVGVAGAWGAVYSGEAAEDVVNRVICDPTITHRHEDRALMATYIYSAALLLGVLAIWFSRKSSNKDRSRLLLLAVMTSMTGYGLRELVLAAHDGASLVYLQGAAVHHPSAECTEFE